MSSDAVGESFPTLSAELRDLVFDLVSQVKQGIRANSEAEFGDICAEHGARAALDALDARCAASGVHMVGRVALAAGAADGSPEGACALARSLTRSLARERCVLVPSVRARASVVSPASMLG